MATVLVTGGLGFIGSHVVLRLLDDGHRVIIFDGMIQYIMPTPIHRFYLNQRMSGIVDRVTIERGDLRDGYRLAQVVEQHQPNVIIHLGNTPLVKLSQQCLIEASETIIGSCTHLMNILSRCREVSKFVYISSSMVYGHFTNGVAWEEDTCQPTNAYGALKLGAEHLIRACCDVPWAIARPTAVYGPTDVNNRVVQLFVEGALNGRPIRVIGESKLDFTFVTDVSDGICAMAFCEQANGEVFNIARGDAKSLSELAAIVASHVPGTKIEHAPQQQAGMPRRGTLDISKASRLLGFSPRYSLPEGLAEYIDFVRSALERIQRTAIYG